MFKSYIQILNLLRTNKGENKYTLIFNEFKFRCCVGKNGFSKNKIEGDKSTPKGLFSLGKVYYRPDRIDKPNTKLKTITSRWPKSIKSGPEFVLPTN